MGHVSSRALDDLESTVEDDEPTLVYRRTEPSPTSDEDTPPISLLEPCGLFAFLQPPSRS